MPYSLVNTGQGWVDQTGTVLETDDQWAANVEAKWYHITDEGANADQTFTTRDSVGVWSDGYDDILFYVSDVGKGLLDIQDKKFDLQINLEALPTSNPQGGYDNYTMELYFLPENSGEWKIIGADSIHHEFWFDSPFAGKPVFADVATLSFEGDNSLEYGFYTLRVRSPEAEADDYSVNYQIDYLFS